MSTWSKTHRKTIDQRAEVLPPTWCPHSPDGEGAPVASNGVMRADTTRHAARALTAAISRAREVVVAASFLLADAEIEHALCDAAKRGVRVYLLLATEARLAKEPREDSEFEQRALADHHKMLDSLAGWALIRSAPTFHAKVVLVDPLSGGPGLLLTANLTSEALQRNEELAVELSTAESRALFECLRWAMWAASEHEILEAGRLTAVSTQLTRVPKPVPSGVVATMGEPGTLRAAALDLVRRATRSVTVASFGWDADHEVVRALCARARDGLRVTSLARIRPASMPALIALAEAGARVVGHRWLHAKAIVADEGPALVMSANLERHGLDDGFELGVVIDGARAAALRDILRGWAATAPFELKHAPRLGDVVGDAQAWVDRKLIPMKVTSTESRTIQPMVAPSADRLDAAPAPPRGSSGLPVPAHSLEVTWTVNAPRLAPKSKAIDRKPDGTGKAGDPEVFRESTGRIVVAVRTADDLTRAREIAAQFEAAAIVVHEDGR